MVFLGAFLLTIGIYSTPALSNPIGGQVVSGNVSIQQAPNSTIINQSSQKAIINWQRFNIGAQEKTHFQQPAGGVALNRINPTQGASQIYGKLTATGQIILVNPAGIYFGPSAYVNVGGLIASTSDISNQNFLAGKYIFDQPSAYSGSIVNAGTIIARENGLVALVGSAVSNTGYIEANLGTVVLASGNKFTIDMSGDRLINFAVDEKTMRSAIGPDGKPLKDGVSNTGRIITSGGKIIVSAKAAQGVLDNVINMKGVLEAKSVGMRNGEIILSGDPDVGVVRVAAKITASGKKSGQQGGKVSITGHQILIDSGTVIDVSGDVGGGEILVGGNYLGKGPLPNSSATVIAPNARLIADAITQGNGGKVIVWSDQVTKFYGDILARGGAKSGNGGFIETSSKGYLDALGNVDASSPHGKSGTWLLDPANVTISAAVTVNGIFDGLSPDTFTTTANAAVANVATINAALDLGIDVVILTTPGGTQAGTITVSAAIAKTLLATSATLTLNATTSITVNSTISSSSGALNVSFIGDSLTVNSAITTNGGNFLSTTQNATTLANAISTGAGTVSINVNQDGAGTNAFAMNAGSSIATTNSSASAVAINVNTATGSGTAALRSITTGSGGTITVATDAGGSTTGGNITMAAGTLDVGTGTINLSTSQAARGIGTAGANVQIIASNLNATSGSSGIFVTNSGTTGLALGTINSTGGFTLTSTASTGIIDSGTQTVTGTATFAAGSGQDITLDTAANNFGTVAITSGRNISLIDNDDIILGTSTISGTLDVSAGGSISQSGALTITGQPTFTVTPVTSADILLATSANAFSTTPVITNNGKVRDLGIRNTLASATVPTLPTGMRNLSLQFDAAPIALPGTTLTGTLTATANGAISQLGALSGTTLTAKTLNDLGSNIILTNSSNEFTTINLQARNSLDTTNAEGAIQYQDATGFNVSLLRTLSTLDLTSSGAMTDSGAFTIGGTATLNSGAAAITFNTAGNDFSTVAIPSASNVTLVDTNAIDLATSTLSGLLSLTSNGAVTQSGVLTITGVATFIAGAANNITLDTFVNNFSTATITSGKDVKLKDTNGLILGTSSISGTLDVTAGGSLTETGALTVASTPTFTFTTANSDFSLASQANNFSTTPVITDNGNVRDLLLRNTNATAVVPTLPSGLRALTLTFNNATSLTLPAVTLTGNLSATASGPITQSGALIVNGVGTTATFAAGAANNIILDNTSNDFTTAIITTGNNVNLRDTNALALAGISTISGTLDITTNGALTQSGTLAVTVTGLTSLDTNSNNITLSSANNNFSSLKVISGNNVNLRDANALVLDTINAGGTLTVQTNGALTQTGPVVATGLATLIAGAGNDISLTDPSNNFSTVTITSGKNVNLRNLNSLILGAATVSGTLDVTAEGTISQSGILSITSTPTFTVTAANSDILLGTSANLFTVSPIFTNNGNIHDLAFRTATVGATVPVLPTGLHDLTLIFNSAAMALPSVSLSGALSATATGAITQSGALTGTTLTAKTLNNTAGSAPITLNSFSNEFTNIDLRTRNAADSANVATPIHYLDTTGFNINLINTSSTIELTAGDAITQSGIISGSTLTAKTLKDAGANITLTAANALTAINLSSRDAADSANAAGAISYSDASGLDIANIATTSMANITATSLIQSGAIIADSLTAKTLNNAGGAITLNNASNNVSSIDLRARNAADSANDTGAISYIDTDSFDVATIGTLSTISLTTNGGITDSGNITGTTLTTNSVDGTILDFGHTLTGFNATNTTSGNIQLINTGALSITGVSLSGGGNLLVNNTGTTTVTGVIDTNSGNTSLTSTGAVTDSTAGAITTQVLAIKTLNNAGAAITLNNVDLHHVATVDLSARNAADTANAAGAITFRDTDGFDVAALVTSSTATLTGSGALTQSGVMTGSTLTATTLMDAGADITFNNSDNNFTTVNLQSRNAANSADATGNLTYSNANALNISGLRTLNNASITANGTINDSGAIIIGDTLTTSAVGGTVLNTAGNQISNLNLSNNGGVITIVNTAAPLTITGFSQTGSGAISLSNTGALAIANGVTLNSNDAAISLTATDLNLNTTGAINSGTANTNITQNTTNGSIGLGNASGTLSISGDELQRISANNFTLTTGTNGQIFVDGVTASQSNAISGTTTLAATTGTLGVITFENNASTFKALTANADNGINVGTDITTTVGNLTLDADANGAAADNDALILNANLAAAGNISLSAQNGGILLGSPVNLVGNGVTFSDSVTGNQNLTSNSGTGTTTFSNPVAVSNLVVDGTAIAINTSTITTSGDQTYNAPITLGSDVAMTASNIVFANGISGGLNLSLIGLAGDNQFTFAGDLALHNISVIGNGSNNLLSVNTNNVENWDITAVNNGNIRVSGVTGQFDFTHIQNLTGGSQGNSFNFADGASINGLVDGNSLTSTNTLNYVSYTTPISILLADLFYSGNTKNIADAIITNFLNINNLVGSESSTLILPNKLSSLFLTSATSGFVGDPINFTQFRFLTTPNSADSVIFIAQAIYDKATNVVTMNGIPVNLVGFKPSNFSGNIITINGPIPPIPPLPPTPIVPAEFIAQVLTQQVNNHTSMNNAFITVTNNVSATVDGKNMSINENLDSQKGLAPSASAVANLQHALLGNKAAAMTQVIFLNKAGFEAALLSETELYQQILYALLALTILSGMLTDIKKSRNRQLAPIAGANLRENLLALSYKIRSSLNTVGFAELIYNGEVGKISPLQKEYLGYVMSEANNMLSELGKIESQKTLLSFNHASPNNQAFTIVPSSFIILIGRFLSSISSSLYCCNCFSRFCFSCKIFVIPELTCHEAKLDSRYSISIFKSSSCFLIEVDNHFSCSFWSSPKNASISFNDWQVLSVAMPLLAAVIGTPIKISPLPFQSIKIWG